MLQQFVRTADLDKVYSAAKQVLIKEDVADLKLKAFKYYYIPAPPNGIAGIVVEPTEDLIRLQQELLDAVAPFTEKTGTPAAFASTEGGRDIQPGLIDYVANFVTVAAGKKFNPHVTIGVAPSLSRQNVRRAVRGVHVCAGRRGGLPARHFWHGSQGTSDVPANALTHGDIVPVEHAHGDGVRRDQLECRLRSWLPLPKSPPSIYGAECQSCEVEAVGFAQA